jgi:hypothetical protein
VTGAVWRKSPYSSALAGASASEDAPPWLRTVILVRARWPRPLGRDLLTPRVRTRIASRESHIYADGGQPCRPTLGRTQITMSCALVASSLAAKLPTLDWWDCWLECRSNVQLDAAASYSDG